MTNSLRFKANGDVLSGAEILSAFLSHKEIGKLLEDIIIKNPQTCSGRLLGGVARRTAIGASE